MKWKVNTPQLLGEILNNPSTGILEKPLNIFGKILAEVAERVNEIQDPILMELMLRLALFEEGDPYSDSFSIEKIKLVNEMAERERSTNAFLNLTSNIKKLNNENNK